MDGDFRFRAATDSSSVSVGLTDLTPKVGELETVDGPTVDGRGREINLWSAHVEETRFAQANLAFESSPG